MNKYELADLFKKVGESASYEIGFRIKTKQATGREIAERIDVPETRISELKNDNHSRVNKVFTMKLLKAGYVSVEMLSLQHDLSAKQIIELKKMENTPNEQ